MAAAASAPLPNDPEQNPLDAMLDEVVRRFEDGGGELSVPGEVTRIVAWLERREPDVLIEWFREHMVGVLGQQLQVRLAGMRQRSRRRSVFVEGDEAAVDRASPFSARGYHSASGNWKLLGDMLRPDWFHVLEDRRPRAVASLFEMELAKRIISRLPDDETPTRSVLGESDVVRMEDQAKSRAEKMVSRF